VVQLTLERLLVDLLERRIGSPGRHLVRARARARTTARTTAMATASATARARVKVRARARVRKGLGFGPPGRHRLVELVDV
jgi:hypothetical protein